MCGIAGFVNQRSAGPARGPEECAAVLDRMCRVIAHRGPDDQGVMVTGDGVALGMRRLSIIDLAGGHQPLSGCDGSATIVFNGEVYNFRELRRELEARGHRFKTHSDTEAIVHAFEEYGEACVEHLRGMFAFAIWDGRARRLFVARDRAGKKPLYYTVTPSGAFVFGSELKSLLEHDEVGRETNAEALDAYLTLGYVPEPLSIFRGVHKLPPGHHLTFADGRVTVKSYWDFRYEPTGEARREEEHVEELRGLLAEAVRIRLVADVPLGAFLSAGVESSTVVGLMARHTLLLRRGRMEPASARLPQSARGRNYLHNVALDPVERYLDSRSVFTNLNRLLLYTQDFRSRLSDDDLAALRFRDYAARVHTGEALDKLLYIDSKTYLPGDILTKVDRMSMAASLEARVPLLDHKLIEFITRIPAALKMRGLETKHIFKRAVRDLVPAEILDRPKQGFGVPIEQWINNQLRGRIRETLSETRARERGYVEPRYVQTLLDEHEHGRRDHSTQLWALFMLELWHRAFVDDLKATMPATFEAARLTPVAS